MHNQFKIPPSSFTITFHLILSNYPFFSFATSPCRQFVRMDVSKFLSRLQSPTINFSFADVSNAILRDFPFCKTPQFFRFHFRDYILRTSLSLLYEPFSNNLKKCIRAARILIRRFRFSSSFPNNLYYWQINIYIIVFVPWLEMVENT